MSLLAALRSALRALAANKLRSVLTTRPCATSNARQQA